MKSGSRTQIVKEVQRRVATLVRTLAMFLMFAGVVIACNGDDDARNKKSCSAGHMLQHGECVAGEHFETTITPEGGEQRLGDSVVLFAPPGAVTAPTPINITAYPLPDPLTLPSDDQRHLAAAVEFGPPGTSFLAPVTFAVRAAGALPEGTPLAVVPFAPSGGINPNTPLSELAATGGDGGTLPRLAIVGTGDRYVVFQQIHFSSAAVIADFDPSNPPATVTRVLEVDRVDEYGLAVDPPSKTQLSLSNLTDDVFDMGSQSPAWGDCAGLAQMKGLDDPGCRKQLYKQILEEALLQVDAADTQLYEDLFDALSGAVGGYTDGVDLAGDATKILLIDEAVASTLRDTALAWHDPFDETLDEVRIHVAKDIDAISNKAQSLAAAFAIGSDLVRFIAFQGVFNGLLKTRIEAFDRALLPAGGHLELDPQTGALVYVGAEPTDLKENELTRDGAFLAAYAEMRRELLRALDCEDSLHKQVLCQAERVQLYLGAAGGGTPPSLAKYVQPAFYVKKAIGWTLQDVVFQGSFNGVVLWIALSYAIETYSTDVLDAARDQMRRGLAANALVWLSDQDVDIQSILDTTPGFSDNEDRLRYIQVQTVVYMGYLFYRDSARAFALLDRSLFSRAVDFLFFQTKFGCVEQVGPLPVPLLVCPDETAIKARDRLVERINGYASGLFDIYRKMGADLAACTQTPCYGFCGDGLCDAAEEGSCLPDCPSCVVTPVLCEDHDPCTSDLCILVEGQGYTCVNEIVESQPGCGESDCSVDPSVCNDADPCTVDDCVDGVCSHVVDTSLPGCSGPSGGGDHIWSQQFGSVAFERGMAVAVDASGNVIVTGRFADTVSFGGAPLTSAGHYDIFIAKYAANGTHLWSKRFGDYDYDEGAAVATDGAGNIIVTGRFIGNVDFGGGMLTSDFNANAFLVKFDPGGNQIWSLHFGATGTDEGFGVAADSAGNILVTGQCSYAVDFGGGPLQGNSDDIFVVKYNAAGGHLWSKYVGDSASNEAGMAIAVDGAGDVVVAGAAADVDFGGGQLLSAGYDAFLVKYDSSGAHIWSKLLGGTGPDTALGVAVDASGNVVTTGGFHGTADFGGTLPNVNYIHPSTTITSPRLSLSFPSLSSALS